jgi:class 3 adenylate cyclase
MRRYLIVSLLIGLAVTAAVLALLRLGVFAHPAEALGRLYRGAGLLPVEAGLESGRVAEAIVAMGAAFLAAWCVIDIWHVGHKMLVFLLLMLVLAGLSPTLALYGVLFEPFSAFTAAVLATAAGFAYSGTEHGMRKRVLIQALGDRASRATYAELMDAKERVNFAGVTRPVSVVSCRVFNIDQLREKLQPTELVAMGNLFLRSAADFLKSHGGYLDESGPVSVRAVFGLTREREDHADLACRAALELRTRLRILNDECETRWFQRLELGVAVSSGPMTAGVFGEPPHYRLSAIGGGVDFASRLAQANRRYQSDVLVSHGTRQLVKDSFEVRPMEMVFDPERHLMIEVYQLLAATADFSESDRARRDAFWQGVIHYRSGRYREALDRFSAAAPAAGKEDGPLAFFRDRCEARLSGAEVAPPEPNHQLVAKGHARLLSSM